MRNKLLLIIAFLSFFLVLQEVYSMQDLLQMSQCNDHNIQGVSYTIRLTKYNQDFCRVSFWVYISDGECHLPFDIDDANREHLVDMTPGDQIVLQNLPLSFELISCELGALSTVYDIQSHQSVCGNGNCESDEDMSNCCSDCGCNSGYHCDENSCVLDPYCGDGYCNGDETCASCAGDCGSCCGNGKHDSGENCQNCPQDIKCNSYERCENAICKGYCGNSRDDPGEDCQNCPSDVKCSNNQQCSSSGTCITLGSNLHCSSIGDACSNNEECINKKCVSKCGNGRKDPGENCKTCSADVRCSPNQECNSLGVCISLNTEQNCGSIGNICKKGFCINQRCVECRNNADCDGRKYPTGEYECSSDHKGKYEWYEIKGSECIDNKCARTEKQKGALISCKGLFCQDGQCGCLDGYEACPETGQCEKQFALKENAKCGCNFQCESGYCSKEICINPLDITLSSTKTELKPGEETIVTLSISNNLDEDVQGSATLKIGSGAEIVDIRSTVSECTGNICKTTDTLPGRGSNEITVTLKSNSEVTIPISADASYKIEGQDVQLIEDTTIEFTESKKEPSITGMSITTIDFSKISYKHLLIGIAVIVFVIGAFSFVYYIWRRRSP